MDADLRKTVMETVWMNIHLAYRSMERLVPERNKDLAEVAIQISELYKLAAEEMHRVSSETRLSVVPTSKPDDPEGGGGVSQ